MCEQRWPQAKTLSHEYRHPPYLSTSISEACWICKKIEWIKAWVVVVVSWNSPSWCGHGSDIVRSIHRWWRFDERALCESPTKACCCLPTSSCCRQQRNLPWLVTKRHKCDSWNPNSQCCCWYCSEPTREWWCDYLHLGNYPLQWREPFANSDISFDLVQFDRFVHCRWSELWCRSVGILAISNSCTGHTPTEIREHSFLLFRRCPESESEKFIICSKPSSWSIRQHTADSKCLWSKKNKSFSHPTTGPYRFTLSLSCNSL